MVDQGYTISIKALDQASAQIDKINKALKDLQRADQSASGSTDDKTRKSKNLFDELNKGIQAFSKNVKTGFAGMGKDLDVFTKGMTSAMGGIGKSIASAGAEILTFGGIFNIVMTVATLGATKLGETMMRLAGPIRSLSNLSTLLSAPLGAVQKSQALGQIYGVSKEQTNDMLKGVAKAQYDAFIGHNTQAARIFSTIDKDYIKMPATEAAQKIIQYAANLNLKPEGKLQFLSHFGMESALPLVLNGTKELNKNIAEVNKHFISLDTSTANAFTRLAEDSGRLTNAFDSLGNAMLNAFGKPLADAVDFIIRKITWLIENIAKFFNWISELPDKLSHLMDPSTPTKQTHGPNFGKTIGGSTSQDTAAPATYSHGPKFGQVIGGGSTTGGYGSSPMGGANFSQKSQGIMKNLMQDFGLTKEQAAGIVGNLGAETGGFTEYHEKGQPWEKGGVGWAQWTGSRRKEYEAWAKANNLDPKSDEANYGFLKHELQGKYSGSIAAVKRTNNAIDATHEFERTYEGAGVKNYPAREGYANQALNSLNTGASGAVGDLASSMQHLKNFDYSKHLSNFCARMVNMGLVAAGLPPLPSNIATDAARYGTGVDPSQGQRNDIAVMMNNHRPGELGGHVGVLTGKTRMNNGQQEYQVYSSNSEGPGGHGYQDIPGLRWRRPDYIRRAPPVGESASRAPNVMPPNSTEPAKTTPSQDDDNNRSSHEVTVSFNDMPQGARVSMGDSRGNASLNVRTRYAMATI